MFNDVAAVNPPVPVACPIGGRYTFKQYGRPEELYWSRVQGITERPRHNIDCQEWVSVISSCDDNPRKLRIDAEYCATLDHTGKPIGEYGQLTRLFLYQFCQLCGMLRNMWLIHELLNFASVFKMCHYLWQRQTCFEALPALLWSV